MEDTQHATWRSFIDRGLRTNGWSAARLADEIGINRSTVSAWVRGSAGPRNAEFARAAAVALGQPGIEGLLAAGILTAEELKVRHIAPDPDMLTDEELLHQIQMRMQRGQAVGDSPSSAPLPGGHLRAARTIPGKGDRPDHAE